MADSPPPQVLLIIRFTASIPDLPLPISTPKTTTTLSLKQLIRKHIPAAHATSRLRLIHAGKVLADTAPLTTSLSLPPPPPPRAKPPPSNDDVKGKGKERATQDDDSAPEPRKVYIHCSIGDTLTPSALTAEATAAAEAEAALEAAFSSGGGGGTRTAATLLPGSGGGASSSSSVGASAAQPGEPGIISSSSAATATASTDAAPRGFDRLLNTGFTPAEVQQLRSQFRANLSFTHTPDTMPSPEEIRVMEDRWLDNDSGGGGSGRPGGTVTDGATGGEGGDAGGGGGGGWGTATWSDNGGLDDMLYGNVVGFFWPLGALGWGFREEGVWSRRRQIAVLTGFLLNIIFGFLKLSG
ncbi:Conserved membrane [Lasiodiplodia theobromae]|uniref:Conserved membrane n=1 Tax=Lasiodiplodia theobromae TaxID=45133 RepID=UPI0015C3B658|nr:Conserved membrane [Lasiodiplodia theobromae]KAF4539507.1 Conserved membrane [Lasiodiplodia theobromae]